VNEFQLSRFDGMRRVAAIGGTITILMCLGLPILVGAVSVVRRESAWFVLAAVASSILLSAGALFVLLATYSI